jgi:hypothetical protein
MNLFAWAVRITGGILLLSAIASAYWALTRRIDPGATEGYTGFRTIPPMVEGLFGAALLAIGGAWLLVGDANADGRKPWAAIGLGLAALGVLLLQASVPS